MKITGIRKVFVVGAGVMGNGIAQVIADSGYDVMVYDLKKEAIDKALRTIENSLQRFVDKGKKTEEDKRNILAKITPSHNLDDALEADFVIEAIFENLEAKKELFAQVDGICRKNTRGNSELRNL